MQNDSGAVLGYDIGGTKIAVSVGSLDGRVLASKRIPSGSQAEYAEVLPQLVDTGRTVIGEAGVGMDNILACGICAPGPLDIPRGRMLKSPNMAWDDIPIRDDLADALELPVYFDNDANGGALAEWFFGAAQGCRDFIYLTMSTGVGGGIIANGALLQGTSGLAGELGHVVLDHQGPLCHCGMRGCLEAYCGGRSVADRLKRIMRESPVQEIMESPRVEGDLERLDYLSLREAVRHNVPFAVQFWDEVCMRLAQGMGIHMMSFNPELIVLGTLAVYSGDLLMDRLNHYLPQFVWSSVLRSCRIQPAALGSEVGELSGPCVALYGLFEQGEWKPW